MNETKAILLITAGTAAVILGFTVKQFFAAKGVFGVTSSNRQIATWKGRVLFFIVGALLLLIGIKFFVVGQ